MSESNLLHPPHPRPLPALPALGRVLWHGDGNLLELLPAAAYRFDYGNLGYSRRSTVLFNQPDLVRDILRDDGVAYSELLTGVGIATEYVEYAGMIHGFFNYLGLADDAEAAHDRVAAFLKYQFT